MAIWRRRFFAGQRWSDPYCI